MGVVLQFLLLIPFARGLQESSRENHPGMSSDVVAWGIGAVILVVSFLLLGVGRMINDMAYMLPQGVFGVWLILVNASRSSPLPRGLRVFGIIVGCGLVLVGTVFPGMALFVYPNMWKMPAVSVEDETFRNTVINKAIHLVLAIGSLFGVVPLPIWTMLAGLKSQRVELLSDKEVPSPDDSPHEAIGA
jgi:hypothetical protein